MQKWEHLILEADFLQNSVSRVGTKQFSGFQRPDLGVYLSGLGSEGWELVAVTRILTGTFVTGLIFLKRPVADEDSN
jgi:hypothetical protein